MKCIRMERRIIACVTRGCGMFEVDERVENVRGKEECKNGENMNRLHEEWM